ncbi:MAG: S9 family peptidase [Acidimicrobiales bacterium]|nr:S9 family peptidase [Acidimicrobiales bacterium]MCB9393057.1 S9 family peptidase [Acidimicrobiaceae bacterium]
MSDTFPRQYARTQRFTLGEPRNVSVSTDEQRVVFLRSRAGDDPVNCLWVRSLTTDDEVLVADPVALLASADEAVDSELPPEERARRERMREGAGGITAYATDRATTVAAFALAGRLFVAGLLSGAARELVVEGPVFDPRPDPLARRLAYVSGTRLRIAELDGSSWELAGDPDPEVTWGSADFVAAEEMHRFRGYWWHPEGVAIAACRVDNSPVQRWHIGDPADPRTEPHVVRYPAAGTANPEVTLHVLALDGGSVEVMWDRDEFPYLATVSWTPDGRLLLGVQSRDQRTAAVLEGDPETGDTAPLFTDVDDAWVELVPGSPAMSDDGRLVVAADREGRRCLLVDGVDVTPPEVQVRSVAHVGHDVTFLGNPLGDATVLHVYRWDGAEVVALTDEPGIHAVSDGVPLLVRSASLARPGTSWALPGGGALASHAETPLVEPNVTLHEFGDQRIATAVLLPRDHDGSKLPVLLDPYGGPHAQRVVQSYLAYASSQWFADQGFAVVVADGRGTPGRGSAWERAVHRDLATAALDDQIAALQGAAAEHPELDLSRVAIRGWSFGGYLAALAVLVRPDVFHAAVAGAPVTEWRLYDTHYTERYLGDPTVDAAPYAATSLLPLAKDLTRPLLLVHGLADDNVVAAHSLQLSSALLAAGKPHELLALVGVSHMTPQEVVAENLLLHQLDFLRRSLPR